MQLAGVLQILSDLQPRKDKKYAILPEKNWKGNHESQNALVQLSQPWNSSIECGFLNAFEVESHVCHQLDIIQEKQAYLVRIHQCLISCYEHSTDTESMSKNLLELRM